MNEKLHYAMDWDVIIRISQTYPVVTINEFLGVSREYDETKTSTGKLRRIAEIFDLIAKYSGAEMTPGTLFYALETLTQLQSNTALDTPRNYMWQAMQNIMYYFHQQYGEALEAFPADSDPQDVTFVPLARSQNNWSARPRNLGVEQLPSISVVVPSYNQGNFLGQTLDSILSQRYPRLEVFVMDGGSTDNSIDVIKSVNNPRMFWVSEADSGPANAINRGFRMASGDVLAWLNSDDTYAIDSLWEVAEEFARDPELDMVIANALYVNEDHTLHLAHHGTHRTGFYYGKLEPHARIPAYWEYVHSVPQPTVFFRRRLFEQIGGQLDESLDFIFDFELFFRFAAVAKIKKLERTNAFYRIHTQSKTGGNWTNFLIELYRFSRPKWFPVRTRGFLGILRSYVINYMQRKYDFRKRDLRFWMTATVVAAMVVTRVGNPEALGYKRPRKQGKLPQASAAVPPKRLPSQFYNQEELFSHSIQRSNIRHNIFFCSLLLPRYPGYSGGEIRDFHLIRHLLSLSNVHFFALYNDANDKRLNVLHTHLENYYTTERAHFMPPLQNKRFAMRVARKCITKMRTHMPPVQPILPNPCKVNCNNTSRISYLLVRKATLLR